MKTPIKIEHLHLESNDYTIVEWTLGNTCNYSCSYCPNNLHDGSVEWLDYNVVEPFIDDLADHYREILGKKIFIQFTGGEPTLYPEFKKLIKQCKDYDFYTSIISNGSRTIRFWNDVVEYLDRVHITYHYEAASLDHIEKVVNCLYNGPTIHINFPMIPNQFDEIMECAKRLHETYPTISITLKPLRKEFGAELFEYTEKQLDTLREPGIHSVTAFHPRGRMNVIYDDGASEDFKPNEFVVNQTNKWFGWKCEVGTELLTIDMHGEIYRGICKVGGSLGNVSKNYVLPFNGITCNKSSCSCITDIMVTKTKRN